MVALILAGGRGKRLDSFTHQNNKCLIKIKQKSLLQYNLEHLCQLKEITSCVVVVGYCAEKIMNEIGNCVFNKKVVYCYQKEQKGVIDAIESAKWAVKGEDFFMLLGDEMIINNRYKDAIRDFYRRDFYCNIGIIRAKKLDLVRKTYTFKIDPELGLTDFIEKPLHPFNMEMGTGNVIFNDEVFDILGEVPANPIRGERELVDLFSIIQKRNKKIGYFRVGDHYVNINCQEDLDYLRKISALIF